MIVLAAAMGLVCGIAVNALADNLMREEPLPFGAWFVPRCGYCDAPRTLPDWSAIFSSLFHSGGCRRCGAPRPFRDLLVEAVLWVGFPAIWMTGGGGLQGLVNGGGILFAFVLFAVIDFERRLVAVEAVALASLFLVLAGWSRGAEHLWRVLGGGAAGFVVFLSLFLFGKILSGLFRLGGGIEPLGFGDVILAALVGLATGWPAVLAAMFLSIFLGGIAGVGLLAASLIRRNPLQTATMAYGPYLLLAGLIVFFFGGPFLEGTKTLGGGF
ncbi:MAG: prepilin peptidase [Anaerolineales bacterium]|nr:prepilin peptidase [Anaerolineales bacterium]